MKILFFGDVVGKPGRQALEKRLKSIRSELGADFVIVNGENSAGGLGITPATAREMFHAGAELLSSGNHIWNKKEIFKYLDENTDKIIRPANFPEGSAGKGYAIRELPGGKSMAVINLQGRVFIPDLIDCPFRCADELLDGECGEADIIFVDFHAEATSEKVAMGYHLDGRVHAVVGTHTHVQTADERLLPKGTAFICDVGMCGPRDSVIGVASEMVVQRFKTAMPARFEVAKGSAQINAVVLEIDDLSMKATAIRRVTEIV